MALRRHQTSRWIHPFAKAAFLQCVAVSASHAVELKDVATDIDTTQLAQLNLDSYNPDDDEAGLDLYLDVTLNGASAGLTHFYYRDDQLWASPNILQKLGFFVPVDNAKAISLNSLPDLKIDYDARQQTVSFIAPLDMLNLNTTVRSTLTNKQAQATSSSGMLLNYNIYGTQTQDSSKNLSAYTELRAFNNLGVLNSTALTTANSGTGNNNAWDRRSVRLDTSWSQSFPDKLITVRAGDILTSALSWTRSTRLGGLQIGTNFSLQPYKSTTPLPSFFGTATLPSAVELYVNGLKQYNGDVPAGPFELNTAPNFSGAGTAQLIVTDALGQSTTLNFSLYDTHRLLQPGLSDWSLELGTVRKSYGIHSFDYSSNVAASGTWRYGVNDRFTAEAHAEVTNSLNNGGIAGTWLLGKSGGILFASLAGSESQDQKGMQYSANYSWNNSRFNLGLSTLGAYGNYRDVGTQYGSAPASRSEQISTGYSTESMGRFGISYNQVSQSERGRAQFASAYWSKSFGRELSLNANYNHDINSADNNSFYVSASLSLDRNISLSNSVQHTDKNTVFSSDVSRTAPNIGGIGWRAQARHSLEGSTDRKDNTGGLAELNYLGRYGQARAGISSNNGDYASYASATGAVVALGGGLFAARQINNGFAVVSTNGIADIPVSLQNSPIGRTNSKGLLLVTPLNAYQENKIAIDPMQLSADLRIDKVDINATPTELAGILVDFNITPVHSASVILVDSNDQPLPLSSQVRQLSNEELAATVVGFDGEVYLDTLDKHNVLEITTPSNDTCTVSFDYSKQGDEIPLIGPFVCHKVQP
ncbi:MAG: fimbria/pilus outer membrane usher protein [Psychrobacter sp.]